MPAKKKTNAKTPKADEKVTVFEIDNLTDEFQDLPGGFGQNWNPEKEGETLEGRITEMKFGIEVSFGKQKKTLDVCLVADSDGVLHSVWHSATLTPLFNLGAAAAVGRRVRIQYQGLGTKKKGQNAPKLYKVQLAK
jgi:hypothetical protein